MGNIIRKLCTRYKKDSNKNDQMTSLLFSELHKEYHDDEEENNHDLIMLPEEHRETDDISGIKYRIERYTNELKSSLKSKQRPRDYVEQANIIINNNNSLLGVIEADELTEYIVDTDVVATLSELSDNTYHKFARVNQYDKIVTAKMSYMPSHLQQQIPYQHQQQIEYITDPVLNDDNDLQTVVISASNDNDPVIISTSNNNEVVNQMI